ncbi:large subunit ribosomal protein L4 [Metamycoplasma subdolum]|uniref:Large ribosomal subunit protein uL4 n=1 Tax=Metamycoplasma subdolum TaxID=92407 RepID=A0A3M0A7X5_9BACT|nr:50S ribosomal protein L4 [Metamycoplasma subdolum]RMA78575.1 large subunit ribosomal protein L4 [Metamycoplasma subdolum]WPB50286.1 50S ribosomal protein L4 [Metamycoplasma subdolum]
MAESKKLDSKKSTAKKEIVKKTAVKKPTEKVVKPKKETVKKEVKTEKVVKTKKEVVKNSSTTKEVKKPSLKVETKPKKATKKEAVKVQVKSAKVQNKVKLEATLPKSVFGISKVYSQAIFDAILSERASKRFSTHKVKSRAEVSGTGKKPFAQKGTGNARAGSLRSPIMVGGGRAFGPTTERNYNLKVNKKVRKNALLSALTLLAKDHAVLVHEFKIKQPSTKTLLIELNKHGLLNTRKVVIVSGDENVFLSARNLPFVEVTKVTSLSVEQLVAADALILTKDDVKYLEGMVK